MNATRTKGEISIVSQLNVTRATKSQLHSGTICTDGAIVWEIFAMTCNLYVSSSKGQSEEVSNEVAKIEDFARIFPVAKTPENYYHGLKEATRKCQRLEVGDSFVDLSAPGRRVKIVSCFSTTWWDWRLNRGGNVNKEERGKATEFFHKRRLITCDRF